MARTKGDEIVEDLHERLDASRSGEPLASRLTLRTDKSAARPGCREDE